MLSTEQERPSEYVVDKAIKLFEIMNRMLRDENIPLSERERIKEYLKRGFQQ